MDEHMDNLMKILDRLTSNEMRPHMQKISPF